MSGPLSNPSPSQYENAYPTDSSVQRPMDGSAAQDVVTKFLARKSPDEQPRHPQTGQFVEKR